MIPRSIAYTLASREGFRSLIPDTSYLKPYLRAELAKEEYATTWQKEEQGEPQEKRVPRPEIYRRAQRKALDTLACRVAQDKRAKGCGSKGSGQTQHEAERDEPEGFADPPALGRRCGSE
jgi:hypothetical protein